ncbi:dihydroneopterin aldolase [Jannaschia aquimarina]|uniref:dihydroneopterin aldolase n=1 Tax=Jannaschia aquimarina TaxID=935700 RepID=A0A0D1EJN5_9RHOB|nr:dihydroneopterin aldolase [Jannaschia aquimarina]KIT17201.1 bifunctional dihydroneopterin aldolase/dihydroneopterin triphosphate 2'-epimerase [Jannaschia aquimarina]SNT18317.1 dihydroneopterin aldolase [Jannaschia aquimarina]
MSDAALRLAFAAPLDRARASGDALDRISLRDHVRLVEIGAFQEERGTSQRLRFDIVAEVAPAREAVAEDDVDGILSYDTLIEAIDIELAAERLNLLETLAERIAARVLIHEQAARTFVRIEKLDRGPHALGVEIVRSRADTAPPDDDPAPHPHVALLEPGALDDGALTAQLDALAEAGPTVILCAPTDPVSRAAHPAAQRRIDLLALETAAWQLAARDPRCVVVASRTEIDHALRTRPLTVWAPSRIVLDATDPPVDVAPATLARWFAAEFDAKGLEGA